VAGPAAGGLRGLVKNWRAPEEETVEGRWGGFGEFGGGELRSQRRTSMSWQDLVSKDGADVDSFRQLPLFAFSSWQV
jgi:hypothetical protein